MQHSSILVAALLAGSSLEPVEKQLGKLIEFPKKFSVGNPGLNAQVNQLLEDSGTVGDPRVMPYYTGDPRVMPYYPGVGAPIAQVDSAAASGQRPIQYAPMDYVAGDVTWFGIGRTTVTAGGARQTIDVKPQRPMAPQSFRAPSTVTGLLLHEISIAGTNIFNASNGVPIEFFSEVSTAPQIVFPTIETSTGVQFVVSNPTVGDLVFSGAFFGAAVRR